MNQRSFGIVRLIGPINKINKAMTKIGTQKYLSYSSFSKVKRNRAIQEICGNPRDAVVFEFRELRDHVLEKARRKTVLKYGNGVCLCT